MTVKGLVEAQKEYFNKGETRDIAFRKQMLTRLEKAIKNEEENLYKAFEIDLSKSRAEAYMAEISLVLSEIKEMKAKIKHWSKPKKVRGTIGTFPSKSYIYMQPYGVVLVLAPWNYPLLLALSPLAGAIAAGNCVVLKCSKSSPNVAHVIQNIIAQAFENKYVVCVDADTDYDEVLKQDYDYIFFTGSPRVGKQVMAAASERLIPVSLELGGKSPCFVTDTADIKMAAKRIAWGKLLNAGQTCITVDYVLVDNKIKEEFIEALTKEIELKYPDAVNNPDYPRIISPHHFDRLFMLIERQSEGCKIIGGQLNREERKIGPTIIRDVEFNHPIMEEEIFGPIIPVIGYDDLGTVLSEVMKRPHPLACYIFTSNKILAENIIEKLPFGGGCVNDTILHIANPNMPFGGVGNSGMGGYHGYFSFETFSHKKSIIKSSTKLIFDFPIRYAPFDNKKWKFIRKFL